MSSETSFNFISREGIHVLNTQNSTSLTSGGCLTILGGASINKDILIGGSLIFPNQNNITLNPNDLLSTFTFTASQTQISQTISNLSFSSDTWGFDVYLSVRVIASTNLYGNYHIRGVNKVSSWVISANLTGDNTGITFDITTSGQLTYTSPTYPSFSSLLFKYKFITN